MQKVGWHIRASKRAGEHEASRAKAAERRSQGSCYCLRFHDSDRVRLDVNQWLGDLMWTLERAAAGFWSERRMDGTYQVAER